MTDNYGEKYPGSGGATDRPRTGGADWYPLPDDAFDLVPVTEKDVEENRPDFFGRLVGRKTTYTETEVVRHQIRKKYH